MGFSDPATDSSLSSSTMRSALDRAMPVGFGPIPMCRITAPTGWVKAAGLTIGSASSGATERANADTEDLFTVLWENFSNTYLPIQDSSGVATTRGLSAAADFAANKRMPTPNMSGRVAAGVDDMSGSGANVVTNSEADEPGGSMGAENHTLITSEMPTHNHELESVISSGGATYTRVLVTSPGFGTANSTVDSLTSIQDAGGGNAHNNMQPTRFFNFFIKL